MSTSEPFRVASGTASGVIADDSLQEIVAELGVVGVLRLELDADAEGVPRCAHARNLRRVDATPVRSSGDGPLWAQDPRVGA